MHKPTLRASKLLSIKFRPFSSITYLNILPFELYSLVFVAHFPLQDWCFLFNKI